MKNHVYKFTLWLTILSIVAIAAARSIFGLLDRELPVGFYFPFLFFFLITIVIYKLVTFSSEKYPGRFPAYFMGGTTIKLLTGLVFLVLYAFRFPSHVKAFFVLFLCIYLIYNVFEVFSILHYLKDKKQKQQP
jgi:hypothetical protein